MWLRDSELILPNLEIFVFRNGVEVSRSIRSKGIGLWAHDKSESTQGRGEDR
jgi:hypothetical protein